MGKWEGLTVSPLDVVNWSICNLALEASWTQIREPLRLAASCLTDINNYKLPCRMTHDP